MSTKLIAYHVERLKSTLVQTRLDAINELRLLGDPSALEALEQVYRSDPDEDVRKAAQTAGREIFLKSRQKSGSA